MTDTPSNHLSESHPFRFGLIRDAALDALRPVDSTGDALLILLARSFPRYDESPDATPASDSDPIQHFVVAAVNEAGRKLFSRNVLSETLDRVNRDLDAALRAALREQRLPVEQQRMTLHGMPFRISMRQFEVEGNQFIGIAIATQHEAPPLLTIEDETSILSNPTDDERTLARRLALRALYEIDSSKHLVGPALSAQLKLVQELPDTAQYVITLVNGVLKYSAALDDTIRRYAPEFPIEQLALIDRNVLRIAIFEFGVVGRVPVGAAIDEAVELAKIYGADGSASFVNGVLGSLADDAPTIADLRALFRTQTESSDDSDPSSQA